MSPTPPSSLVQRSRRIRDQRKETNSGPYSRPRQSPLCIPIPFKNLTNVNGDANLKVERAARRERERERQQALQDTPSRRHRRTPCRDAENRSEFPTPAGTRRLPRVRLILPQTPPESRFASSTLYITSKRGKRRSQQPRHWPAATRPTRAVGTCGTRGGCCSRTRTIVACHQPDACALGQRICRERAPQQEEREGEENELTGGSGGASERGLSVDSESSRSARSEDAESRSSCRIVRLQAVRFSHDVDASNMIHGPDDAFLLPVARTSKSQTAATTSEDGDLRGFSGFDESPIPRRRRLRPQPVFDVAQKGPVTVRWVGPGPKRPSHIFLYPQLPSSCACRHEQNCPRARTNMLGGKKLTCHHLQIDRTCGDEQKAPGLSTQSCPQAHIFAPVGWFILCPRARTAYPRGLLVNLPPSPFA